MKQFYLLVTTGLLISVHAQTYRGVELRKPLPRKDIIKVETYLSIDTSSHETFRSNVLIYNRQGYPSKEIGYDMEGGLAWGVNFSYSAHQKKEVHKETNEGQVMVATDDFFYNASGLIQKEIQKFGDNSPDIISYLYNKNDQLIREQDCDERGCVTDTLIYKNNQLNIVLRRNAKNEYFDSTVYAYDTHGYLQEWNSHQMNGELYNTARFVCDSSGQVLKEEYMLFSFKEGQYSKNNSYSTIYLYQYYSNGKPKIIEEQAYDKGKIEWSKTTEYNELGDIMRIISWDAGSNIVDIEKMVYYRR